MKKLLTIIFLIMLIISFFQITSMYALYKEELESDYSTLLGVWKIKVNESDVVTADGQTSTFTISDDNIGYVGSTHVLENKIAPGEQAYIDIEIDPADTDVSIVYKIDMAEAAELYVENISSSFDFGIYPTYCADGTPVANATIELVRIDNYFQKAGDATKVTNEEFHKFGNTYTGVIPVSRIREGYKNYIRLYFEWVNVKANDETETNNETDTSIGIIENAKVTLPMSINLKQYTGEVISNDS